MTSTIPTGRTLRRAAVFALAALASAALGALPAALLTADTAAAQSYPNRPIRMIIPFPAGGSNDILGRIAGQKLQEVLGQPVVIDNRAGGGTQIGTDAGARAEPDGYTILQVAFPFGAGPSIYSKLPYDPLKDFAPIVFYGETSNMLVAKPTLPVKSVRELIDLAKAKPKVLNYASAGLGTSNHLGMELFKTMAGIDLVHIPYKGTAVVDMVGGGNIDVMFDNTPNVLPQVQAGKLRALAVTTVRRSALMPDLPTVAEAGVPGFELLGWYGFVAPAGTPPAIIDTLNKAVNKILTMPDVRARLAQQGVEPRGGTPAEFAAHLKSEVGKWKRVVKEAHIPAVN